MPSSDRALHGMHRSLSQQLTGDLRAHGFAQADHQADDGYCVREVDCERFLDCGLPCERQRNAGGPV